MDVLSNRCDKDKARLFLDDNLHLLASPLEGHANLSKEEFESLLLQYANDYDYIIIDSPAGVGELPLIYAQCAHTRLVVATPDNVSARSACVAGTELVKNGIDDNTIFLIINRFDASAVRRSKYLNIDEIMDITYIKLLGVVPEEKKIMYTSVKDTELSKSCKAKICFDNIAGRILGKEIPLNL